GQEVEDEEPRRGERERSRSSRGPVREADRETELVRADPRPARVAVLGGEEAHALALAYRRRQRGLARPELVAVEEDLVALPRRDPGGGAHGDLPRSSA